MSHTEDLVHAWNEGVDGSSATDFVFEFWCKFLGASHDSVTLLVIWVPSVFNVRAGLLTKSGEGNLRKAILDNFVTFGNLVGFPVAKFARSSFDGFGNLGDLFVG